jgi:hypothetical protein
MRSLQVLGLAAAGLLVATSCAHAADSPAPAAEPAPQKPVQQCSTFCPIEGHIEEPDKSEGQDAAKRAAFQRELKKALESLRGKATSTSTQ